MFAQVVNILFQVYTIMIFGRLLGSWIPELRDSRFMLFLSFYTDPYLNLFRRVIPPLGAIDLSPIVAFFVLSIVKNLVLGYLL